MPHRILAEITNVWDKVASASDKVAIKVIVAIVIGYFLFRDSSQENEKDNTIRNLREDLKTEKFDHRLTKSDLLNCSTERNNTWKEVARQKDSIIKVLSKK